MSVELPRPGVEVIQKFTSAAPTLLRPTLVPFVVGAAREIVDVLKSDGTINSNAKQGSYTQLPKTIAQTSFPSPRGNILEVDVDESSIRAFFMFGGRLAELARDPGEGFFLSWNKASKAAIQSKQVGGGGFVLDGLTMVFAVDQTAPANLTKDFTVTFDGGGSNLTAQAVADQINAAAGADIAAVVGSGNTAVVQVTSSKFGAASSVTIRAGGSGNTGFGVANAAKEYRVEGSGFRAQDQSDNTTFSPWIEWSRGDYLEDRVSTSFPVVGANANYGLVDESGTFAASQAANITFGSGSTDLKVGDQFYADGVTPNSSYVMKVEAARFKLGTLDTALSIFDSNGKVLSAVYDVTKVQTLFGSSPFSPRHAWFRARNLSVTDLPVAAKVEGANHGVAATSASITGSAQGGSLALTGLTMIFGVTIDGVVQDDVTFTFTGAPMTMADAATALTAANIPGLLFGQNANALTISTSRTGQNQALALRKTSTAGATLGFVFGGNDLTDTGTDVEFRALPPVLTGANQTFNFTPTLSETLIIQTSSDGGTTWGGDRTFTWPNNNAINNIAGLVAALNTAGSWNGGTLPTEFVISNSGNAVVITGATTGKLKGLRVKSTSTGILPGATNAKLQFVSSVSATGVDAITGQELKFTLNERPKTYSVIFTSNSLPDAVEAINNAVGFTVASIDEVSDDQLILTSPLRGAASSVTVTVPQTNSQANLQFGFNSGNYTAVGSGRPNPDFSVDITGSVVLNGEILRELVTGVPFDPGQADVYLQYVGLRHDVSPIAKVPALLQIGDTDTLNTVLSPINARNPLGLGMFFAMVNAPGMIITGMGVDDAPASAPDGTLLAHTRVANFIESQEVYAIAPLSHDTAIGSMWNAHAVFMSGEGQKGERIVLHNSTAPTRAQDKVIASGLAGNSSSTDNEFVLDVNPAASLLAANINPALAIPVSADLLLEITVGGEVRRYNVRAANGVVLTLRTTFTAPDNVDGFYTTTPLTESLINEAWSLRVRGAKLLIPGSTLPDKNAAATTVAAQSATWGQRRFYNIFPDKVTAVIDGTDQKLEGYYACAAVAGMIAHFPPQQGFTNLPMVGFSGVLGSNDTYSESQLNVMAGGGTYILVQDAQGAPLTCRHQLSTDLTSIETRELSITKIVDFTAKFLRRGLRRFIGTFNITTPFLDSLSTVIHGMLKFLEDSGVLVGGELNNLVQSKDQPDTVLVDVILNVPFPCNYIRLTLVV